MTRLRPLLLLPLLALAACQTLRKPLNGYSTPPPGLLLDDTNGSTLMIWPIFDLPQQTEQIFQPRLNGQDTVVVTSQEGFYDYAQLYLEGWTGGWSNWLNGIPPDTYVVELVDENGQSYGKSAPLPVPAGTTLGDGSSQLPAVIFTHYDDQAGSWTIDPSMQDSDPATDEITVTNLLGEDVVVQRCLLAAAGPTSCTTVGTVAPGADLNTVETLASASSVADHQALFVQLASDSSQSYERELVQGGGVFGASCQIERILVHGIRSLPAGGPTRTTGFAMSSCYGYSSGPTNP
jgi:hypothetical protein